MFNSTDRILITGANGLIGYGVLNALNQEQVNPVLLTPSHQELDLLDESSVLEYFKNNRPDYVFHLAACVYGLKGNTENQFRSLSFNTKMVLNLSQAIIKYPVKKIFFAGTVAQYPYPYESLPLKESMLFKGDPHFGEYGYAVSKNYAFSVLNLLKKEYGIPFCFGLFTNVYGINDRFNTDNGHVVPSLLKKAYDQSRLGKSYLEVWGNPNTTRDFIFNLDAGRAVVCLFKSEISICNISSGEETKMGEVTDAILKCFPSIKEIKWQQDKPVGIPRRYVDNSMLLGLGYKQDYSLANGIASTVDWMNKSSFFRE